MTDYEKMRSGNVYVCASDELSTLQEKCLEKLYDFNQTHPSEHEKRAELLKDLLAEVGDGCYVEPPLHANWGCHTHFGRGVYANFNLTLVDDNDIFVGDYTMFGPNVTISAAGHPIAPELRGANVTQFNIPVHIGKNVWLGAGVIVLPGVTIGDNSVIGAGSVVTHDIPANSVAVGTPCKVVREINERDREFYYKDRRTDPAIFEEVKRSK